VLFHDKSIINGGLWPRKKPPDLAVRGLNPPKEKVEETIVAIAAQANS
jgi:hypothetical protein